MKRNMIWLIFAALLVFTACGALAAGEIVLPDPADLETAAITAGGLELTVRNEESIVQLLELLNRSVKQRSGKESVQDVPNKGAGLVRIDFGFREGGASTVFLYREDDRLFLEQPYQGIYEMEDALEEQLRQRIVLELARSRTGNEER